jgi:hypothetical protein
MPRIDYCFHDTLNNHQILICIQSITFKNYIYFQENVYGAFEALETASTTF